MGRAHGGISKTAAGAAAPHPRAERAAIPAPVARPAAARLDAGPELMEEAVRRAFAKSSPDWAPEVLEQAVQHVANEGTPAFQRP